MLASFSSRLVVDPVNTSPQPCFLYVIGTLMMSLVLDFSKAFDTVRHATSTQSLQSAFCRMFTRRLCYLAMMVKALCQYCRSKTKALPLL